MKLNRLTLVSSQHPSIVRLRRVRRALLAISLPVPRPLGKVMLSTYVLARHCGHFVRRVFFAEPLFKAYCKQYGRRLRTDIYVHWVQGKGEIRLGDDVLVDGKCSFTFAARFCESPVLRVGSNTVISHGCQFTIGKSVEIGNHCLIASDVMIADSSGHPVDPALRLAGLPPDPGSVRPVVIEDNVWVGRRAIILPGVTIGEGSVIAAGSVVRRDVPPYTLVAGNPATERRTLTRTGAQSD